MLSDAEKRKKYDELGENWNEKQAQDFDGYQRYNQGNGGSYQYSGGQKYVESNFS